MRKGSIQSVAVIFLLIVLLGMGSIFLLTKNAKESRLLNNKIKIETLKNLNTLFVENKKLSDFSEKNSISIPEGYRLISYPIKKNHNIVYIYEIYNKEQSIHLGENKIGLFIETKSGKTTLKIAKESMKKYHFNFVQKEVFNVLKMLDSKTETISKKDKNFIQNSWK